MRNIDNVIAAQHIPALATQAVPILIQAIDDLFANLRLDSSEDRGIMKQMPSSIHASLSGLGKKRGICLTISHRESFLDDRPRLWIDSYKRALSPRVCVQ